MKGFIIDSILSMVLLMASMNKRVAFVAFKYPLYILREYIKHTGKVKFCVIHFTACYLL